MHMDYASIVALMAGLPYIGKILVVILSVLPVVVLVATSLVGLIHSLVGILQGLAKIPGLEKFQGLADSVKKNDEQVSGVWNGTIKPVIDRLSVIPLPKVQSK